MVCRLSLFILLSSVRPVALYVFAQDARDRAQSDFCDVDDSFGEGSRSFLRQIVPDAAPDGPVRISARELLGIGVWVRVRRTVGVTFESDGWH